MLWLNLRQVNEGRGVAVSQKNLLAKNCHFTNYPDLPKGRKRSW